MDQIFILQALFAISQVESSPSKSKLRLENLYRIGINFQKKKLANNKLQRTLAGNMAMNSNTMQRDMSNMMYYNGMYWYFDSQTQQVIITTLGKC